MASRLTYRADLDGLRALSIVLVVGYHAGLDWLGGGYVGVDVFFVLSGFLITALLISELEETGRIDLLRFFARRIRRLLPMASVVLVATLLAAWVILPPVAISRLVTDIRWAVLYAANWNFASQSTAYSDTGVTESLTIHFWSLSIEEQFYFFWPLLLLAVGVVAARLGRGARNFVLCGGIALVAVSLTLSVVITSKAGSQAYFFTHLRLWEMGVGAVLAALLPRLPRLGRRTAALLSLAGLALVVTSAVSFDELTPYPGSAAVVPVLGTSALVVAHQWSNSPVGEMLSTKPFVAIGHSSYGWYLWHWPAIGLTLLANQRWTFSTTEWPLITVAVAGSLVLAAGSYRLIENPVRHSQILARRPTAAVALGVGLMVVPLVAATSVKADSSQPRAVAVGTGSTGSQTAAVGTGSTESEPSSIDRPGILPLLAMEPAEAASDKAQAPSRCHLGYTHDTFSDNCVYGQPDGEFSVVLTGDSHALTWFPPLRALAEERGWQLRLWSKDACVPLALTLWNGSSNQPYEACEAWERGFSQAVDGLNDLDLVIYGRSMGYRRSIVESGRPIEDADAASEAWGEAALETFGWLEGRAGRVVVLRDVPWFGQPNMVECVSLNPEDHSNCARPIEGNGYRDQWMIDAEEESGAAAYVEYLDPTPLVCPDDPCAALSPDGVIKYRDSHHLTATFAASLAEEFAQLLELPAAVP